MISLWRIISDLMPETFGQCPGVLEESFRTVMSVLWSRGGGGEI